MPFSGIYCIPNIVQLPPLSSSRTFSSAHREILYPLAVSLHPSPSPRPQESWVYFVNLLIWTFHVSGIRQHIALCFWLLSLSRTVSWFIYAGTPQKPRIIFWRADPLQYRLPPLGECSRNPSISVCQLALL